MQICMNLDIAVGGGLEKYFKVLISVLFIP